MEKYEKFIATNGKGSFHRSIDISKISEYDQEVLSSEIVALLDRVGVSSYLDGKFWTLDPTEYVDWLNEWLPFEDRCVPFARSAFGDILFVRKQEVLVLNSSLGIMSVMVDTDDLDSFMNRYLTDSWFFNTFFNGDIFDQLEDKSLSEDECFAFHPMLSLRGSQDVKSVKRVKMKEHLHIISSSSEVRFYEH